MKIVVREMIVVHSSSMKEQVILDKSFTIEYPTALHSIRKK